MSNRDRDRSRSSRVTNYTLILAAAWTVFIVGLLLWAGSEQFQDARELVRNDARAHFLKNQAFRLWGASHGGVYVPVTERTPPNPYLSHIPDRDIETSEGKKLTLMNPAYMMRQLLEDFAERHEVRGHITSLKLLRPENAPDDWERAALESFERGETEVNEFAEIDGEPYLRLMRPLMVEQSCLKCHRHQGYREGDVRGGISVSVPAAPYFADAHANNVQRSLGLGLVWLLGVVGMTLAARRGREGVREREQVENALHESEERYRAAADYTYDWESWLAVDGTLKWVNPAVERLTGYSVADCQAMIDYPLPIVHEDHRAKFGAQLRLAVTEKSSINDFGFRISRKDGEVRWGSISWQAIYDEQDEYLGLRTSVRDITERRLAEKRIAASLKEKEVLLREIHHRVKNNMQVIVSIMSMHARRSRSERIRSVFDDCRDRVYAMSLIHEALYQSEDLARIDFDTYLTKLCRNLSRAHGAADKGIVVTVERCDATLGIDQGVAIGLVICELVSNAFKHAFPSMKGGTVSVGLSSAEGEEVELIVQDDGVGLPVELDIMRSPSLGLELAVAAVTRELGGSIEVACDGGTRFTIRFQSVRRNERRPQWVPQR